MLTFVIRDCDGCLTYSDTDKSHCSFTQYVDECPCALCIIKVMCKLPCDDFTVFREKFFLTRSLKDVDCRTL